MGSADTKDIEAFLTAVYRAVASAGAAAGPLKTAQQCTLYHTLPPFSSHPRFSRQPAD